MARRLRNPELEANPPRTIDDLPEDVFVSIFAEDPDEDGPNAESVFIVYLSDAEGLPLPPVRIDIQDVDTPETQLNAVLSADFVPECGAYEVTYSMAAPGWGPLVYDLAMEYATDQGFALMSDRKSVSAMAHRLWQRYMQRPDVKAEELPLWRRTCQGAEFSSKDRFSKRATLLRELTRRKKLLFPRWEKFESPLAPFMRRPLSSERARGFKIAGERVRAMKVATPKPLVANPGEADSPETERLIIRAAQMLGIGMPLEDIVEQFMSEGVSVGQALLAARAGELFARQEYTPNIAAAHERSVVLMKFIAREAQRYGIGEHVYVVGGAVRNFILGEPIKDIDIVIDSIGARHDSAWFAKQLAQHMPAQTNLTTNQYGVAILSIRSHWDLDGHDMHGETIEIANARAESYAQGGAGKGYKPTRVRPASIEEDVMRREFRFNTLLWRMSDLISGPEHAEIIDLTGCGLRDLEAREIRTPAEPDKTFADDPTRMLRAIKFLTKYQMTIPADIARSIRKNAPLMAQMPWEALGTIFVNNIVREKNGYHALQVMEDLELLQALVNIANKTPPFVAYLSSQLRDEARIDILLGLLTAGFKLNVPVAKLTSEQLTRLRGYRELPAAEQAALLGALARPPIDSVRLIEMLDIEPRERGRMATLAREALLRSPALAGDADALTEAVLGMW